MKPAGVVLLDAAVAASAFTALRDACRHYQIARRMLDALMFSFEPGSSASRLTREDLCRVTGMGLDGVNVASRALDRLGIVRRERVSTPGQRGSQVRYIVNPHIAWAGDPALWAAAREATPPPILSASGYRQTRNGA